MNKIIIADDDFIVRTYLKQMIDWEKHGFLLFDAKNGKEALDICRKEHIDIIITDMSMPVMNGMELIKALKQYHLSCHVIVLSCHDDFIYVKEAMKLGAEDYLLKNDLTPEGLLDVLQKINLQENKSSSGNVSTEELAQIGRRKLRNDFFRNFTAAANNGQDLISQARQADIQATFATSSAVFIKLTDWRQRLNILENEDIAAFKQAFREMCQNICQNNEYDLKTASYIFQLENNDSCWVILLDFAGENSRARLDKNLKIIAQKIISFSLRYFNLNAVCAVSDIQSDLIGLKRHFMNLLQLDDIAFYHNSHSSGIFTETDFDRITAEIHPDLTDKLQKIVNSLDLDDETFQTAVDDFLDSIQQNTLNLKCLNELLQKLQTALHTDFSIELTDFVSLKMQLTRRLFLIKNKLKKDDIAHPAIRLAVKYIDKNYRQPLSQQIVADYVHLNPAYFSTLFKKSTGVNFSDYLINCRLNAVKKRLINSSDKIKNISLEEGFADYQYFCKLFKKIVGVNPSEYRNK